MFLTEEDYIMASDTALKVLQQSSKENRERAERMAIEEVSGYLRSRYDAAKVFAATGDDRNDLIVMRTCDVALYHLSSWLPNRMARDTQGALRTRPEMAGRGTGREDYAGLADRDRGRRGRGHKQPYEVGFGEKEHLYMVGYGKKKQIQQ